MAGLQVKATSTGIAMTPRKVGEVASLVRGRSVADALVILEHTPRRAAIPVAKTIASAKANAEKNHNLKGDSLEIVALNVGPGPRMKRFKPVARGMAHGYQKRSTQLTVVVEGELKPAKKTTTTKVTGKAAKKETK